MLTFSLILTFCTLTTCEEYKIDHSLSKPDCIEAMIAERRTIESIDSLKAYRDYMSHYQAEKTYDSDNGVAWKLKCEKEQYSIYRDKPKV